MSSQDEILQSYQKALKCLPGSRKKNEEYRNYIRDSIQEVFKAQSDDAEQSVLELLGTPEAVKNSYIESLSPEELEIGHQEQKKKNQHRIAVLAPVCILLAVIIGLFIWIHFFPETDVAIAKPVDQNALFYIERPVLIGTGNALEKVFGKSANRTLHERMFIDNTSQMEQYFLQRYPNGCHITCTVLEGKKETAVRWTGTGTTAEGMEDTVFEQYVCPYHFHVQETDELSGQAAGRARYAEEENRRIIEAMG